MRLRGRRADARAAAGDDRNLARQHLLRRLAELRLLQRPVFDIEHVGFGDAAGTSPIASASVITSTVFSAMSAAMAASFAARAEAEQADARHQHDARQRIELGLLRLRTRTLLRAK